MMQSNSDLSSHKHSLLNVMKRFIAAANNMDETIMVPTLLRDVPLEDLEMQDGRGLLDDGRHSNAACPGKQRDMYEHYLLLKSIKNDMEWGLLRREMSSSFLEMAVKQEQPWQLTGDGGTTSYQETLDLQSQFHYHLWGLFGVLSKLTLQADHLTNRYKREIGGGSFMR